jgi:hypothetical protein
VGPQATRACLRRHDQGTGANHLLNHLSARMAG